MQISIDDALIFYSRLPIAIRFPSYHPYYIVADAKREANIVPTFFVYTEKEHIYYHGFHLSEISGTKYKDIQSPYGYGGPLATTDNKYFLDNAWQEYCLWCREQNVLAEFIRFHPILANEKYYHGQYSFDRRTIWINLTREELLGSYNVRVRTAIRKAVKNKMIVEWWKPKSFLQVFPHLYRETMKSLGAEDGYFFNERYFAGVVNLPRAQLAICKYNEEIVAGAVFLVDDYEMEYHLSAATIVGKKMSATNLMLHEAALLSQKIGCKALHLGGGTDGKEDNPLLFFKAGFSNETSSFYIGYHIYQPDLYQKMKMQWKQQYGMVNSRILFYR